MTRSIPERGDLIVLNFSPQAGHEHVRKFDSEDTQIDEIIDECLAKIGTYLT